VLLVDDHPAVRLGARELIDAQPDMKVAAEAGTFDAALRELETPVDVAVIDFHLGRGRDGLSLTMDLKQRHPACRVLIYSAFADGALTIMAIIAGADGLLGKQVLGEELPHAIRRLARGQHHLPAVRPVLARAMRSVVEPRDRAIFGMLLHGSRPEAVAERLGLNPAQLHGRRVHILRTLNPAQPGPTPVPGANWPLDYQRPYRRASRRAA
jgi:DNA-binding NarL/FixJ family response regulator